MAPPSSLKLPVSITCRFMDVKYMNGRIKQYSTIKRPKKMNMPPKHQK
jgi:hypothetical protein